MTEAWKVLLAAVLVAAFLIIVFVLVTGTIGYFRTGVPYGGTPRKTIRLLAQKIDLTTETAILELGSGTGRVCFEFEKQSPAQIVGIESTLWAYLWSRLNKTLRRSRVTFIRDDFLHHDWSHYSLIYCYLVPPMLRTVNQKILTECRPGTRIVSRDFALTDIPLVTDIPTSTNHRLHIYRL